MRAHFLASLDAATLLLFCFSLFLFASHCRFDMTGRCPGHSCLCAAEGVAAAGLQGHAWQFAPAVLKKCTATRHPSCQTPFQLLLCATMGIGAPPAGLVEDRDAHLLALHLFASGNRSQEALSPADARCAPASAKCSLRLSWHVPTCKQNKQNLPFMKAHLPKKAQKPFIGKEWKGQGQGLPPAHPPRSSRLELMRGPHSCPAKRLQKSTEFTVSLQ